MYVRGMASRLLSKIIDDTYVYAKDLIGYGLGCFLIKGLRTDSLYLSCNIRVSQILSLVLLFIGSLLLIHLNRIKFTIESVMENILNNVVGMSKRTAY
jgi:phosphatidylglycerol:prolipoprotein diacylglycerol transferase